MNRLVCDIATQSYAGTGIGGKVFLACSRPAGALGLFLDLEG
jgi:hypothetical protein